MDDLTSRLRAANPFRNSELSVGAQSSLDDILEGRRVPREGVLGSVDPRRRSRAPRLMMVTSVVVAVLALVLVSTTVWRAPSAGAVTPIPLHTSPIEATVTSLLEELMGSEPPSAGGSRRGADWSGWYLQLDGEGGHSPFIQPQSTRAEWNADFSGIMTTTAGAPVTPEGIPVESPPDGYAEPGTTLYERVWSAGELTVAFRDTPPTDARAMRAYLDTYLVPSAGSKEALTAGDYLNALGLLMEEWTLDPAAQRVAIEVILTSPGIEVAGETTDRAGRAGVVLAIAPTVSAPLHRAELVIDTSAWRLLALERLFTEDVPEFDVSAGSVSEYTIWR